MGTKRNENEYIERASELRRWKILLPPDDVVVDDDYNYMKVENKSITKGSKFKQQSMKS